MQGWLQVPQDRDVHQPTVTQVYSGCTGDDVGPVDQTVVETLFEQSGIIFSGHTCVMHTVLLIVQTPKCCAMCVACSVFEFTFPFVVPFALQFGTSAAR